MRRSSVTRTVRVAVEFEPGEVPDRQYYSHTYRPTRLVLAFTHEQGDAWKVNTPLLSGPRVNKGGRLSDSVTVDESLWRHDGEWPEWLTRVVAESTPADPGADLPEQAEHTALVDLDAVQR